jgi:four helix bundle protein
MAEAPDPDLRERTFLYSVRAVRLYEYVCKEGKSASGVILGEQFLRCATSLGADIDEAQHAESRTEYLGKLEDAAKEAREGLYWLRLIKDTDTVSSKRLVPLEQDTREIIAMLTSRASGRKTAIRRK